MCEAIAAFKPVCDDIAADVITMLIDENFVSPVFEREMREETSNVMQTKLRELTEKANSTPA